MEDSLCITRLNNMRRTAKKAEGKLLDTVLSNLDTVDSYTINSLAEEAGVSYATVCRMLDKVGVSGFKEFKKVLSKAHRDTSDSDYILKSDESISNTAICDEVCDNANRLILNCRNELTGDILDRSVDMLCNAGSIMFAGLGSSAVAARYAYIGFLGIISQCFFSNDMIMAKMKASLLNKGDVLFAVSSSGRTKPVIEAAKIARSSGAAVISLCDFSSAPLIDVSDVSINTGAGNIKESMNIPSIQGQITAINVLYSCVSKKRLNNTKKRTEESRY